MTTALVLGGGGVVGVAWEIGVLCALEDAGLPGVLDAGVVVGTSAGSFVASQLYAGQTLADLAAGQADDEEMATPAMAQAMRDPTVVMEVFRLWGTADPMTQERAAEIGAKALEAPTVGEDDWLPGFAQRVGADWPAADFRVVAVRCHDGARAVWTRESGVPLSIAVASSCTVPGLFPPVTIGDARYTDGSVWSSGNADVVADAGVTQALFIGPMVGPTGVGLVSARALEHEAAVLAGRGIALHTIVPGERFRAAGFNLMDATRREEGVAVGREEGARAAKELADALAG